jgi:signal transduction histidine kinase
MISWLTSQISKAKKKMFFIFFALACHQSFSQNSNQNNKEIDSLMNVLKTTLNDTNRVITLNELSRRLFQTSTLEESEKYTNEALRLAEELAFKKGMADASRNMGIISRIKGYHEDALKNLKTSLKIYEEIGYKNGISNCYASMALTYKLLGRYEEAIQYDNASLKIKEEIGDKKGMCTLNGNIGVVYRLMDNYPEALKSQFAALKIAKELGDKGSIAGCYGDIGTIYGAMKNNDEALKYFSECLKMSLEIGNKPAAVNMYNYIGLIYKDLNNYSEALTNIQTALKISEETQNKDGIATCYSSLGTLYYLQGNYSESLKYELDFLRLMEELGNKGSIAIGLSSIGKTYIFLNDYSKAKEFLLYGLSLSNEIGSKAGIERAYMGLSTLDSVLGDYCQALEDYKLYTIYKDSLLNENNSKQIAQIRAQYESEQKDKEIELLNKENDIQQLQLKKQKQTKNYFIAGLILFVILSFFIYWNYQTRQKLKLLTLRNKIASDLHDDIGSTLSSISIFSQMATEGSKEVKPMLETIGDSSRKMLDAMADIVWTIHPENDKFEKIIMRMRSFAYELLGAKQIDFRFVADSNISNIQLSMEARRNLYLIFKEATNNLVKYSEATHAMFTIKEEKDKLLMLIKDNGKGFDSNRQTQGNGIKNMKKRASEMGAMLQIDSVPGNGTAIQLELAV